MSLSAHIFFSRKLLPELLNSFPDRVLAKQLLKFGWPLVLAAFAAMLVANLEKGLLPKFVSVAALAYYSVGFTLASMAVLFSQAMGQSLLPAFSLLRGNNDEQRFHDLYFRALRINLALLFPTIGLMAIIAQPFFTFWAGPDFGENSILPFYACLFGLLFNIPAYLPSAAIMSTGKTSFFAKLYFAELIPYIFIVPISIHYFGIVGAGAAWSLRLAVDAVIFFSLAGRLTGVRFPWSQTAYMLTASLLFLVPIFLRNYYPHLLWLSLIMYGGVGILYCRIVTIKVLRREETQTIVYYLKARVFSRLYAVVARSS